MASLTLTAAEAARLNTFCVEIACSILARLATVETDGFRVGRNGSLKIWHSSRWYDFEAGRSGRDVIALIQHLRQIDRADALVFAREWLASKSGEGSCSGADDDEEVNDDVVRQAFVNELWAAGQGIKGTAAEAYLVSRGVEVALDAKHVQNSLRFIANYRGEEGLLLASFTDEAGNVLALHATHVTPAGQKSAIEPVRQIYRGPHNWRKRALVRFDDKEGKTFGIAEGLEDALSLVAAGCPRVAAVGGVGALGRCTPPVDVDTLIIARDGDVPGSPADQSVHRGIVRSLAQRLTVKVTAPEAGADPNDILCKDGPEALKALVDGANLKLGRFDTSAFVEELHGLDELAYGYAREGAAAILNVNLGILDKDRIKARRECAENARGDQDDAEEQKPWPDPVPDLGPVLETIVDEVSRYVVLDALQLLTVALWAALTHCIHALKLGINVAPKLAIQSADTRCGKTTLLEALYWLILRPLTAASVTASSIFRSIEQSKPTFLIDEADQLFRRQDMSDLLAVVNSGHRRRTAFVMRTEKADDGKFEIKQFATFGPVAFAGIRSLPETLQDRSIVVTLQRALPGEVRAHLRDGESPVLMESGRKLMRWAMDLESLPEVTMPPELFNRHGDNWFYLLRIAQAAGDEWFERACKAAAGKEADQSRLVQLLDDIWQVFAASGAARMYTDDILEALLNFNEGRWKEANYGRPLTAYTLSEELKGVIPTTPEARRARRWREGTGPTRWGYKLDHLADAWRRYLGRGLPGEAENEPTGKSTAESSNATASSPGGDASNGAAEPARAGWPDGHDLTGEARPKVRGARRRRPRDDSTDGNANTEERQ